MNWNGNTDTRECLMSLENLKSQTSDFNIILVDNASQDNSVKDVQKEFPTVDIIRNNENLGFTGGNNIGIKRALDQGADLVWLLNNDTTIDKIALQALVGSFDDVRVGIAGSKIYFSPGREFHKNRYKKSEQGNVLWYAGGVIDWQNMYASHRGTDEIDNGQYDIAEETPFVTGCSMMVKREVFEKVGLLDEKFFAYLEDLDFCLRAKQAGYKLIYVPRSIIWHKNAGSSGVGSQLHQYYMTRNRLLVGMRYAQPRTKLALLREGIGYMIAGPAVRRKAIVDGLLGRYGKQSV